MAGKYVLCALALWFCMGGLSAQTVLVDRIEVTGVQRTKPLVILRQMTLAEGDTLQLEDLEAIRLTNRNNIYNLGLFTKVDISDTLIGKRLHFRIDVQERWYIWPRPYVNLEERTFAEWWVDKDLDRLVYGLGVEWQNVSGWNDRLYVYGQNGYSQRLSLLFSRPFLFPKAQIDGRFGLFLVNDREIGHSTVDGALQLARLGEGRIRKSYTGTATFGKRFGPRRQLQLGLGYLYYELKDSIRIFNPNYLTSTSNVEHYPSISLSFVEDQRDWRAFPLQGYKYSLSVRQRGLPGIGTTQFTKIALSFSHHIPLGKRWNFAYGTQNFFLLGDRAPFYDKYFIGFGSFLRGYEYYVIDGSFVNLTKAEWKFALIPRQIVHVKWIPFRKFQDFPLGLYISAFSDAGYVRDDTFNNQDNYLKQRLLMGYGMGLNLITIYDSLFRVEYSRNLLGFGGIYLSAIVSIQ